jgi:hypothetical protein
MTYGIAYIRSRNRSARNQFYYIVFFDSFSNSILRNSKAITAILPLLRVLDAMHHYLNVKYDT